MTLRAPPLVPVAYLHSLPQHVISLAECIVQAGAPVSDIQQLVIGDDDQAVNTLLEGCDALHGLAGTPATLKAEGVGHNGCRQDACTDTTHTQHDMDSDQQGLLMSSTGGGAHTTVSAAGLFLRHCGTVSL